MDVWNEGVEMMREKLFVGFTIVWIGGEKFCIFWKIGKGSVVSEFFNCVVVFLIFEIPVSEKFSKRRLYVECDFIF